MSGGQTVWSWESTGYFALTDAQRAAADTFVAAHGIRPDAMIVGNVLRVVNADDRSGFWLHTWRAVLDGDGALACPHCPHCVQQVRTVVRLVAPPPNLPDAFFDPDHGLRMADTDDADSPRPHG